MGRPTLLGAGLAAGGLVPAFIREPTDFTILERMDAGCFLFAGLGFGFMIVILGLAAYFSLDDEESEEALRSEELGITTSWPVS